MNPRNNAGELNLNADCKFKRTVRKGNINENPRGGSIGEFVVQIGEGLGVVKAKALNCFRSLLPESDLISEEIYFKKSKGASQSSFVAFTTENFNSVSSVRKRMCFFKIVDHKGDVDRTRQANKLSVLFYTRNLCDLLS